MRLGPDEISLFSRLAMSRSLVRVVGANHN